MPPAGSQNRADAQAAEHRHHHPGRSEEEQRFARRLRDEHAHHASLVRAAPTSAASGHCDPTARGQLHLSGHSRLFLLLCAEARRRGFSNADPGARPYSACKEFPDGAQVAPEWPVFLCAGSAQQIGRSEASAWLLIILHPCEIEPLPAQPKDASLVPGRFCAEAPPMQSRMSGSASAICRAMKGMRVATSCGVKCDCLAGATAPRWQCRPPCDPGPMLLSIRSDN